MRTNDTASRSMPWSTAKSTQSRSDSSTAAGTASTPGRFMPWWEATVPPVSTRHRPRCPALAHPEPDRPVGEIDHVVGLDRGGQPRPRDGDRVPAVAGPVGGQGQVLPVAQVHHVALDVSEPDLRPGDVAQQADLAARLLGGRARHLHQPRVVLARAVGEVEPQDVRADRDQAAEDLRVVGGRPSVATILVRRMVERLLAMVALFRKRRWSFVEVEPAEELLRLAPAPRRHAQRDVAAAEAVQRTVGRDHRLDAGLLEVLPPGARRSTLSKSPTTSQSSKRGSPTCSSPWPGTAPRARRAASQPAHSGSGRPRRNSPRTPHHRSGLVRAGPLCAARSPLREAPHHLEERLGPERGPRLPDRAGPAGAGVPHRVWRPGRHLERVAGVQHALLAVRPAPATRPRAPRSAPPGSGGSAPGAPGRHSPSSTPPPAAPRRCRPSCAGSQGLAGDGVLEHVSRLCHARIMRKSARNQWATSIRAGNGPEVDMKAFVTGGTGFIGSRLVRRLRERGDDVVALVRSPEKASELREQGCELVEGDLSSEQAIRDGVQGCDAVFHVAAVYKVGIPASQRDDMWDANVRGTERVLDAAIEAGVPRIVYVSTVGVFGNTTRPGRGRDLQPRRRRLPVLLRRDEVPLAPGRARPDRQGRADRDRAARRRLRPRRPLRDRQHHRPDADRAS